MESIEQALATLGAPMQLGGAEARALDIDGYVVLGGVVAPARLPGLQRALETLFAAAQPEAAGAASKSGTRHADGLVSHSDFCRVALDPRLLAAVRHVLRRRFVLCDIHARDPLPGFGQQGLHADWHTSAAGGVFAVVTALLLLDDFTSHNGATRLVPGSHRGGRIDKSLADPCAVHPREVVVEAAAGSALVFNGHVWHSATRNRSHVSRRTLQIGYRAFELRDPKFPGAAPLERLTPAEGYLLGA